MNPSKTTGVREDFSRNVSAFSLFVVVKASSIYLLPVLDLLRLLSEEEQEDKRIFR